jgi:hypothetical protein
MRGKMVAKRRAAGLGCGNLKAAIADNGNEPLLHGKRPGRNRISTDRRENSASTVSRRIGWFTREENENMPLCGSDPLAFTQKVQIVRTDAGTKSANSEDRRRHDAGTFKVGIRWYGPQPQVLDGIANGEVI